LYLLLIFAYDGGTIGKYTNDAIRNITGSFNAAGAPIFNIEYYSGPFKPGSDASASAPSIPDHGSFTMLFNLTGIVPVAHENRPVSIATLVCISY